MSKDVLLRVVLWDCFENTSLFEDVAGLDIVNLQSLATEDISGARLAHVATVYYAVPE